jgi:hypothetical protein
VLAFSAPTFLNLDETVSKAGDRAFGKFRDNLIIWVAVAAAVLAVITIFVPLGASYADRYLTDRRQWETETEKSIQQRVDSRYSEQLKGLSDEVSRLREEINSKKPSPSSSSRATNSRQ